MPRFARPAAVLSLSLASVAATLLAASSAVAGPTAADLAAAGPRPFVETFDGRPDQPAAWSSPAWDIAVHSRDRETWEVLEPMHAGHGEDCAGPPAGHLTSSYGGAVFQCRDHLMTAIKANGYGMIYLTPNQLVDFSGGEAVVNFDVSTERTSARDWIDLWVTPFQENLVSPLDRSFPDGQGEPRDAVHVNMTQFQPSSQGYQTLFGGTVFRNATADNLKQANWTGYEKALTPSAVVRTTFELRLSRTHVRFGIPAAGLWWVDTDMADLGWDQGIVQFGHHSYTPEKQCPAGLVCGPDTWHWDNVKISSARPFAMVHAEQDFVTETTPPAITFAAPLPANAYLRFAAIGSQIELSFDDGATWQPATGQPRTNANDGVFRSYWTRIPDGALGALVRGQRWFGGRWFVRDLSAWSLAAPDATPSPDPAPPLALARP